MRDDPRYAELWERAFGWPLDDEVRWLDDACPELAGGTVCELGAGCGRFMTPLLERAAAYRGLEPNRALFDRLAARRDRLPPLDRSRVLVRRARAEESAPEIDGADVVMLLTDTLSYLWPATVLDAALATAARRASTVLVLDVALWGGAGEVRQEEWHQGGVAACCDARVERDPRGAGGLRRRERIVVGGLASEHRLHAFTPDALTAMLARHDLAVRSWDEAQDGPRRALVVAQRRRR